MDLSDDHLKELGRLAATAAEVEFYLHALVCELVNEDIQVALLAVGNPPFHQMVEVAPALLCACGLNDKDEQLRNFLLLAKEAMGGRNRILHSHWVAEDVQVRKGRSKDPGVRLEVGVADIKNAIVLLENASSGLNFMWVEIAIALGRAAFVDGVIKLPDRTGTGFEIKRGPSVPLAAPARWAHGALNSSGAMIYHPSDPELELNARDARN